MRLAETKAIKIYILGSSGFIGSRIFEYFTKQSFYTTIGYSSINCNLLSMDAIEEALSGISENDIIIMTSAITRLLDNSFETMIKNIKMVNNVATFIAKKPVSQVIFLSTIDVYGINAILPINENNLLEPNDYYAISKLSGEFILKKECSKRNIPLLILRLPGIFGKGDEGKSTINKLVNSAKKEGKITILGNGLNRKDFVYVDDVCRIIYESINRRISLTLNIATGEDYSILEIVDIIRSYFSKKIALEYKVEEGDKRQKDLIFDIHLLKKHFPQFEFTNIKEGIKNYINLS